MTQKMRVILGIISAIFTMGLLTGFSGFWAPDSFEQCREKAAREAKTESGFKTLVYSCRKQFPKQSELQEEWVQFSKAVIKHKYDPSIPIEKRTNPSIPADVELEAGRNNSEKEEEFYKRLVDLSCQYGGQHLSVSGQAKRLKTREFINWFAGQSIEVRSLLVLPMPQKNEDQIFTLYENERSSSC